MPKMIRDAQKQILDAAKKLLEEEGYEAFNIRNVAKASGIGVGTIYNYFPTKENLLFFLINDFWSSFFTVFKELEEANEDFCSKLNRIYGSLLQFSHTFHEVWIKLLQGCPPHIMHQGFGEKRDFMGRFATQLEKVIIEEKANGKIADNLPCSTKAFSQFLATNLLTMTHVSESSFCDFIRIVERIITE